MKSVVVIVGMLGLVACCGDNIHTNPPDATPVDAAIDSPADAFVTCNYTEMDDLGNDYLTDPADVEQSNIKYSPGDTRTICGTINTGHYDAGEGSVDIDDYYVEITQDADVLVTLIAANGQSIPTVGIFAFSDQSGGTPGFGYYIGDHAVYSAHLTAGVYQFSVEAYGDTDAPAPIPYKMRIQADNPTQRCATNTGTIDYMESMDGINSNMNDTYAIDYSLPTNQITLTTGTPEPTNLMIADSTDYRVDGVSDSVAAQGSYFDRDAYLITAGSNQMAVRLDWTAQAVDLDYYIFTPGNATPIDKPGQITVQAGGTEFGTQAVDPGKPYIIWVGASDGSTTDPTKLPTNYTISICGETGITGP
jgi:hypothetical protein